MARIAFLLFTAVALFYSQCARAEPAAVSCQVSYAQLDLRTSEGGHAMLSPIRRAMADVCMQVPTNVGSDFEARRAVEGLGAPKVSQLFDGGPAPAMRLASGRSR